MTFAAHPGAVFIPAAPDEDYTACYGYDRLGPYLWYCDRDLHSWAAVFPSAWNDNLAAVGLNIDSVPFDYRISVYTNVTLGAESPVAGGTLASTQIGTVTRWGFTTIHLANPVPLADRGAFSVVVENTNQSEPILLMCCDGGGNDSSDYSTFVPVARRTYVNCAGKWEDTYDTNAIIDDATGETFNGNVCLKAYTRTTARARAGDAPGDADDGGDMMMWLHNEYDKNLSYATSWTFGAYANLVGANGRTLVASWLAGLDPADASNTDLRIAAFGLTNGIPRLSWTPDLGTARTYTVYGADNLANPQWQPVDTNSPSSCRFFKVGVAR